MKQKTVSQILKKAKHGDILTDGKRYWFMDKPMGHEKVATPIIGKDNLAYDHKGFELWEECELEKVVILPKLKILKRNK